MNETQQNIQNFEIEINLVEIFKVLWKRKIVIISISLIGAILAGLFSIFMISPVYNTELKIDLNIPQSYITKYGEYKLPISTNGQYIDLIKSNDVIAGTIKNMDYSSKKVTLDSLKKRISIAKTISTVDNTQNIFNITVSANNPKDSLKLANTLYTSYIKYMDIMSNKKALNYYYNNFNATLKSNEDILRSTTEILKKNEEFLAKTPQTIDLSNLKSTNSNIIVENIINPAYSKIQENIVENKKLIFTTEDTINVNKKNIKEIELEKRALKEYAESGKLVSNKLINIDETNIFLASTPVEATEKTSPSNTKNAALGLVIGCMLSVMMVLVMEYWLKKT